MSEENKTVELKDEELEKVAGGGNDPDPNNVQSLNGYSVGDSHTVAFSDGIGSGHRTATISSIHPLYPPLTPYYVHQVYVYSNGITSSGSCYWSKSNLDEFWSKVSAAVDPTGGPKSGSGVASF